MHRPKTRFLGMKRSKCRIANEPEAGILYVNPRFILPWKIFVRTNLVAYVFRTPARRFACSTTLLFISVPYEHIFQSLIFLQIFFFSLQNPDSTLLYHIAHIPSVIFWILLIWSVKKKCWYVTKVLQIAVRTSYITNFSIINVLFTNKELH